jgi:hypothetical protein
MPRKIALLLCFFVFTLSLAGCGSSNPRIAIRGTVTYKGEPLDQGVIAFSPKDASKGTVEGAVITNGKYAIAAANGLFPGEYIVSIRAPEAPANKPPPNEAPGAPRRTEERLPERYNKASTLRIEVTVTGKREFDFPLD